LLIHDGRREARGSSGLALSVLARPNMLGRLLGWAFGTVGGVGVLGRAGSVFCLGCDNDGGVTCVGGVFFAASGDGGWRWVSGSLFVDSGDLVSFATEAVEAACFRCWFSGNCQYE
jgi:hypothetical protein